jgi:hypothetical protein
MLVEHNGEYLNFPIEGCSRIYKKEDADGFKIVIENIHNNSLDGICLPNSDERNKLFDKIISIAKEKGII